MTTDNTSLGSLLTFDDGVALSGNTQVQAQNGVYNFTSFIINYTPGANITLTIQSSAIDI